MSPKMIGYQEHVSGLVLIAEDIITSDTGQSDFDIPEGYGSVEWHLYNVHPVSDNVNLEFQVNATDDAGGGFDQSQITSTFTAAYLNESGIGGYYIYETGFDQANGTSYQHIGSYVGNENDESCSGVLTLYAPYSTTYVKQFTVRINVITQNGYTRDVVAGGDINDTTAISEMSFKFSSDNIGSGTIRMYGAT